MRLVLSLAWAGVRRQPVRWAVLALGIAVASAFPVVAGGFQVGAESAAIRSAVDNLPADERSVVALSSRTSLATDASAMDPAVREQLADAGVPDVTTTMAYRTLSVDRIDFSLAAMNGLTTATRLTSGTMPTSCEPQRCEVVLSSPGGEQDTDIAALTTAAQDLGLVVTGTAELLDDRMVGAGMIGAQQPLLLSASVVELNQLDKLTLFGRTFGWIGLLDGTQIAAKGVDEFGAALSGLTDQLNLTFGTITVRWPSDQVSSAADRAVLSARRFSTLGATGAALQLGFCIAAAVGLRTRQRMVARLMQRRGASATQITAVPTVQAGMAVGTGAVVGIGAGLALTAAVAGAGPPGRWAVASDALATSWPSIVAVAAAAVALAVLVVRWPADSGRSTRVALDVVLVLAVGVTVLAVLRSDGRAAPDDPLTLLTVVLVSLAAGLATARVWPLLISGVRRVLGRRPALPTTLALIGGQRRMLRPAVTAGFVAAAVCSVVFAGAYRITLQDSAADQAAYRVPFDVAVGTSRFVTNPIAVLDVDRIRATSPDTSVAPVTSVTVGVSSGTPGAVSLPLVGIEPAVLVEAHRFDRTAGGALPAPDLAAALAVGAPQRDDDPAIVPAGRHVIALAASGVTPAIELSLWLTTADGVQSQIDLTGSDVLTASVDLGSTAHVTAVEITEAEWHRTARLHGIGEGPVDQQLPTGELTLGTASVDGAPIGLRWSGWGSDQLQVGEVAGPDGAVSVHFQINDTRAVMTPSFVPKGQLVPLPVAADPTTAALARDGRLTVTIGGVSFPATVAEALPRMPTLGARFLVGDQQAIAALVDRVAPGTDPVSQVWIAAPDSALPDVRSALAGPPASTATITYRSEVEDELANDPVATRTADLLILAAVIAMILAAVALAMAVLADRSEEADDLLVWEVDGLPPGPIRQVLLRRSVLVALAGLPLGVVGGMALTAVAVRLISVGAGGTDPLPPLHTVFGWQWTSVVVAGALALGIAAATLAALSALRERLPTLSESDLR